MAGLGFAMRELPVGTSYAVRVGVGAVLTVVYAMATGDEAVSALKVLGGVVGLKAIHREAPGGTFRRSSQLHRTKPAASRPPRVPRSPAD